MAKLLKCFSTSASTVELALGAGGFSLVCGAAARLLAAAGREAAAPGFSADPFGSVAFSSAALGSGAFASVLASAFPSVALFSALAGGGFSLDGVGGLESSGLGVVCFLACVFLSWDDIIAGSTGAPTTVAWPVGARRAGGVYLLSRPVSGGKSCLRTPLYLIKGQSGNHGTGDVSRLPPTCLPRRRPARYRQQSP